MGNITLALPDEVQAQMKKHTDIRWSEVARQAIVDRLQRLEDLREMDELLKNSKLTEKDVRELSAKLKKGMGKRFLDDYHRYQYSNRSARP